MKRKGKVFWYIFLLFGGVFLLSLGRIGYLLATERAEQAAFVQLEPFITAGTPSPMQDAASAYAVLQAQNPDFWGWIRIAGTEISYPVMYTPEEPEYYLHRDFTGAASRSGVPFLSGTYQEGCGNAIIYGHNMKNGTMFAELLSYADAEFRQAHPSIQLLTPGGMEEYEIFAAFYARVYAQDETDVFRFYQYDTLTNPADFAAYTEQVQQAALYPVGIDPAYGDSLLTLVTCSEHTEHGRFVVVARK